jgi:hypothetical protein
MEGHDIAKNVSNCHDINGEFLRAALSEPSRLKKNRELS